MNKEGGDKEAELSEAFSRAMKGTMKYSLVMDAIVVNIDTAETDFTCSVQVLSDGQPTYFQVPLRVLTGTQGSYVEIPQINSYCIICFRDGNIGRPQIIFVDSILKILVTCDNVIYNGGELGGIVKAKELQTQSNKDREILTALLQILTGPPINEPGNGAPSALQAALNTSLQGKEPGSWDELEDPKITH